MQLRIGVVNHIQPGGVLLQQTDTYRWQICLVVPTKGTREAGGGPTPLPPTFPFEEANFCHRAVTNAIKVMQFLLLAEREKSCLLTRMKDGARPRKWQSILVLELASRGACQRGVQFSAPHPAQRFRSIFNFHAYYFLLFLIMTKLCNPTFATLHTPSFLCCCGIGCQEANRNVPTAPIWTARFVAFPTQLSVIYGNQAQVFTDSWGSCSGLLHSVFQFQLAFFHYFKLLWKSR